MAEVKTWDENVPENRALAYNTPNLGSIPTPIKQESIAEVKTNNFIPPLKNYTILQVFPCVIKKSSHV